MSSRKDLINGIVDFKLPGVRQWLSGKRLEGDDAERAYDSLQYHIDQLMAELQPLSESELQDTYLVEEKRVFQEHLESEVRNKSIDFPFLSAEANANLSFWSTVKFWSLDQTTALLLGKDPSIVNCERMNCLTEELYFARRYMLVWADLKTSGLKFPVAPEAVLEWANNNKRDFPKILAGLVSARSSRHDDSSGSIYNFNNKMKHNYTSSEAETKTMRGGAKIAGAKHILTEIYGESKPKGITKKTAFCRVLDTLKERKMDVISPSTFGRAWNELYNQNESASAEDG